MAEQPVSFSVERPAPTSILTLEIETGIPIFTVMIRIP